LPLSVTTTNATEMYARLQPPDPGDDGYEIPIPPEIAPSPPRDAGDDGYEIPIPPEIHVAPLPPRLHAYENTAAV